MTRSVGTAVVSRSACVAALVMLAGCAAGPASSEGGFGLPVVAPDDVAGRRTDLTGVLHVESNGCFTWAADGDGARRWVVWPERAEHDGDRVRLADGTTVSDGDTITGPGLMADADVLPDWNNRDSYFRSFGDFCRAGERGIVVFDGVRVTEG